MAPSGARAEATARAIGPGDTLTAGVWVSAAPGDFLIETSSARFVIDDVKNPHGLAPTGGSLVDAVPTAAGSGDGLGMIQLLLSNDDLDGVSYDSVLVGEESGVRVRAVGRGLSFGTILVETTYHADETGAALEIVSLFRNSGSTAQRIRPTDRILLGGCRVAAEDSAGGAAGGSGRSLAGMRSVLLLAPGADYLYRAEAASEADALVDNPERGSLLCRREPLSLAPGATAVWRRRLDVAPAGGSSRTRPPTPAAASPGRVIWPGTRTTPTTFPPGERLPAWRDRPTRRRYAALDARVASAASLGAGARPGTIARAAALAGLDVVVIADRNTIAPAVALDGARIIPGVLAESPGIGRFLAFPVALRPDVPRGGAPAAVGTVPEFLFGALRALGRDAFITVADGRDRDGGYFERMQMDPATGRTRFVDYDASFEAVEILSARSPGDFDALLADWFNRLNAGGRVVALGGSGCEGPDGPEIGSVRTLVDLRAVEEDATPPAGGDSAAAALWGPSDALARAIARRLLEGRAIVSSGLFLDVSLDAAWAPGDLATRAGTSLAGNHPVRVAVWGPAWADCESVFVYRDGRLIDGAAVSPEGRGASGEKARLAFDVPISGDGWIVAVARGGGYLAPAWPRAAARGLVPIAVANPIYVDADGDGTYTRP